MPIFDYACPTCKADFELVVLAGEKPLCPKCGSAEIEKQMSRPAAPPRSGGMIKSARKRAAAEGHFSNYSAKERKALR